MKQQEAPLLPFPSGPQEAAGSRASASGTLLAHRPQLAEYWRIVRRHKWGIIWMALIGATIGGFRALSAIPIYQATLTVLVDPYQPKIVANQEIVSRTSPYLFYETQYELIRSRVVAERAVEKLGLGNRRGILDRPKPSVLKLLLEKLGLDDTETETAANSGGVPRLSGELPSMMPSADIASADTPLTEEEHKAKRNALISMVQNGLTVRGGRRSQIIRVSYESPDPKLAAEIANAIAGAYTEMSLDARLDLTRRATSWLTERLEDLRNKVVTSEAALQAFRAREGLVDTASLKALTSGRLAGLNQELVRARTKYSELTKRYGRKHPKLIAAKAELNAIRRRLKTEASTVVRDRQKEFELAKLEREVSTNRELYNTFLTRFKQTDTAGQSNITNVRIIDRAQVPAAPYKPDKRRVLMTALILGLLAGIGLAFLREYLDNTFKTTTDIEERLGFLVIGIIPTIKKVQKGEHLVERHFINDPRSSFAESVNHVRTGVLFSHIDDPPKTILVTSSVQGEGKTTVSSNLALSFSQLSPTLLIDADLRKPRVAQVAGLDKEKGLVEVVAGQIPLKDCIIRDKDAKDLYILKSGKIPPNPLEILSSNRFSHLLVELKKRFKHIVIDTTPILPVSDAVVLGHIVDGVLMVLRAGDTTYAMAHEASKRLRSAKIEPLGVVFSQVSQRKTGYYYNDDYYYRGYYSGYSESS